MAATPKMLAPRIQSPQIQGSRILVIDSCGLAGGVALVEVRDGCPTISSEVAITGKTFAAKLIPAVSGLLQEAKIRLEDLDAVAVVHGPGSFTGVRIGVSTAKGLIEGLSIPLIAISRLAVLDRSSGLPGPNIAIFDAGRQEFYVGIYDDAKCIREVLMSYEEVLAVAAVPYSTTKEVSTDQPAAKRSAKIVVCEERVQDVFADLAPQLVRLPTAADAGQLAVERLQAGALDDPLTLDGNYLRRSEVEIFSRQATAIKAKNQGKHASNHDSAL